MIQRKIHHLLESEGQDRDFSYLPILKAPFDLNKPILVTEKVDGSTMQSKNGEPWKRFDRFSKGDPKKRSVPEKERYELRICNSDDPAVKWYLASFNVYKEQFGAFGKKFPNSWIFFEALGKKINGRYRELEPTIRVFDVEKNGIFFPFLKTLEIASELWLPVVEYKWEVFGTISNLIEVLAKDFSKDDIFPPHQLEGWVLRQEVTNHRTTEEVLAKIRVEDLKKLK